MINDLLIPLISILFAEFGDKTQIAIVSASSKYKNTYQIFLGVMLAFLIIDGFAIYFANEISNLISIFWIKIISGLLFILIGILGFFLKEENEPKKNNKKNSLYKKFKTPFFSIFIIILFAEFGDKSQIMAGLFATIYNPILVLIGVLISLSILSIIAIVFGKYLLKKFDKEKVEITANLIFIFIGIITILSLLFNY
jgi:putative Ca2+/H+ antiporter (TMEM165/GDT1 family)